VLISVSHTWYLAMLWLHAGRFASHLIAASIAPRDTRCNAIHRWSCSTPASAAAFPIDTSNTIVHGLDDTPSANASAAACEAACASNCSCQVILCHFCNIIFLLDHWPLNTGQRVDIGQGLLTTTGYRWPLLATAGH
jgi:hypothetical protein